MYEPRVFMGYSAHPSRAVAASSGVKRFLISLCGTFPQLSLFLRQAQLKLYKSFPDPDTIFSENAYYMLDKK